MDRRVPGFATQCRTLFGLYAAMHRNRHPGRGHPARAAASGLALVPGLLAGLAVYTLMTEPIVARSAVTVQFLVNLLAFVLALLWIAWPILSARVEDHAELRRFATFPVPASRLLAVSLIAGLAQPLTWFVLGPLLGAVLAYAQIWGLLLSPLVVALLLAYVLMCIAWSRALLGLVRSLLASPGGNAWLATFLIALIAVGALLPPIDTSWLYAEGGAGGLTPSAHTLARAADAFATVPPGYLGAGLRALAEGRTAGALIECTALAVIGLLGLVVAQQQLLREPRASGVGPSAASDRRRSDLIERIRTAGAALAWREAKAWWGNPRTRVLLAAPLVLAVLMDLLGARALIGYLTGGDADLWLMAFLGFYGATLQLTTYGQNVFAADGNALVGLLKAPVAARTLVRVKALFHGCAALVAGVLAAGMYGLVTGGAGLERLPVVATGLLVFVALTLSAGLVLSIHHPVASVADLTRRRRQPVPVTVLGFGAIALGVVPFAVAAWPIAGGGPVWPAYAVLLPAMALAVGAQAVAQRWTAAALRRHTESLLDAAARG